jgi:alginate O-acetyltransferase complex protein AlgI
MLFNSFAFILLFLPLACLLFWALPESRGKILLICVASMIFYAWWNPVYLPLLVGSVVVNHLLALALARKKSQPILWLGVSLNLLALGFFKYFQLFADTARSFLGLSPVSFGIVLPLAISFYTFQQISYLVDNYYGRVKPGDFLGYFAYVTFFPQLIAGPVVKYSEFYPQLSRLGNFSSKFLIQGMFMFFLGLAKKVIIADPIGQMGKGVFASVREGNTVSLVEAWWGSSSYALQMYYDFSGYSDMAVGLGLMFGIVLPLNFRSPYQSLNINQFWSKWHMTLTSFFTQYLHLPMSLKFGVRSLLGHAVVTLFVMCLVGFWHGAAWNFVIWGGIHGLYLVVGRFWSKGRTGRAQQGASFLSGMLGRIKVFALVSMTYPFFNLDKFHDAMSMFASLFHFQDLGAIQGIKGIGVYDLMFYAVALLLLWYAPNLHQMAGISAYEERQKGLPTVLEVKGPLVGGVVGLAAVASLICLLVGTESEFLYFQF